MARVHVCRHDRLWILLVAAAISPMGLAEGQTFPPVPQPLATAAVAPERPQGEPANGSVYRIYPLGELGNDPSLGEWVVATIPQVIDPRSWEQDGASRRTLSYYAPGKLLVVYHTPAVQAQVADFLQNVRTALPAKNQATTTNRANAGDVKQAQYQVPLTTEPADPVPGGYPVAAPRQQPKHLFHFIIRYEGEGIIDSNVVEMLKVQSGQSAPAAVASFLQSQPAYAPAPGYSPPAMPAAPGVVGATPGTCLPNVSPVQAPMTACPACPGATPQAVVPAAGQACPTPTIPAPAADTANDPAPTPAEAEEDRTDSNAPAAIPQPVKLDELPPLTTYLY